MRILAILFAAAVLACALPHPSAFAQGATVVEFNRLVGEGQEALARVATQPDEGNVHVPLGTPVRYRADPPTTGNHWPVWADPGRHTQTISPEALVHSLEHGHIVVYIDRPSAEATRLLTLWSNLYRGDFDGLVVVPRANLGAEVILTAWTKTLRLPQFEPAAAAAFIDAFRGRGPEFPVR